MVSTGLHCFLVILHFAVYACTSKKSQLQCALFVDDMQNCRRSVFCQPSSGWPSTFLLNLFCFEKYKVICNVDLWSFLKFLCVPICVVNPPPFFLPPFASPPPQPDADYIMSILVPELSEKGSPRQARENAIINFLQDFLQDLEITGLT